MAIETNWTKEEFKAYLLLYAASSDMTISEEEKKMIIDRFGGTDIQNIQGELESDNDYQRVQKILYNLKKFDCSQEECEGMLSEVKEVFMADGKFGIMERNMMRSLKKLF